VFSQLSDGPLPHDELPPISFFLHLRDVPPDFQRQRDLIAEHLLIHQSIETALETYSEKIDDLLLIDRSHGVAVLGDDIKQINVK
jgi:hypothetical protein